jgi:ElaB/YqjD/DUF883 family membrane-anchored ribosome-binding protein
MNDTSKQTKEKAYGELEEEVARLRADIAALADTLKGLAGAEAKSAAEALRGGADRVAASAHSAADRAQASAREGYDALQTTVEKNPLTALLLALGLGFIVGAMSRR